MHPSRSASRLIVRASLGALLGLVALNAFAGGWYGLRGARGVPLEWLAGSPFHTYFVPSLLLVVVIGGAFAAASIAVFTAVRYARKLAFAAGLLVLAWLAAQVGIIGYVSWMQPTTAAAGLLVLALAGLLPGSRAHGAPASVVTSLDADGEERRR